MLDRDTLFQPLDLSKEVQLPVTTEQTWSAILPIPANVAVQVPPHRHGQPSFRWEYRSSEGLLLCLVCRFDLENGSKEFFPLTYCQNRQGETRWRWQGLPAPRPLYNLPELAARASDPVLICEGEKATDAARKLFPSYVAITSSNGSGGAGKTDWSPLAGRSVTIWPDNDSEGLAYAKRVAELALAAKAATVASVSLPPNLPSKWDLADPIPDGIDPASILRSSVEHYSPPGFELPSGFGMQTNGLFWRDLSDTEKPPFFISGPFDILAETRDENGEAWGCLLRWYDNDRREHTWALPRSLLAGDGSDMRARLLDGGLCVSASRRGRELLTTCLMGAKSSSRARCVEQVGWHGQAYVTTAKTYGGVAGDKIILQTTSPTPPPVVRGTLEAWQAEIAGLAIGNSRLVLALSAAFVGPLLSLVGEDSFGFHFSGGSSSGKTTALRVAASVAGSAINTWRTTDNAAESLARSCNDGLLILDELSQADGRAADAMAYMLGNGQGKGRMRKDLSSRPPSGWLLVFLSTGEVGLTEKLAESGKKAKAGQAVRMIEIPADAEVGHKLFDTLHDFENGSALSQHLKQAANAHSGHAADLFLTCLVDNIALLPDQIRAAQQSWIDEHCPAGTDGQVARVAARFALTAAAGELASAMGILPWPEGEAEKAAARCFMAWLSNRGGSGDAEALAGVAQVRTFIELHGASRFTALESNGIESPDSKTVNRAGFRRRNAQGDWEYLVLPGIWKEEICKGADARATGRRLAELNILSPGNRSLSKQVKIPNFGNMRLYHLQSTIFTEGLSHA